MKKNPFEDKTADELRAKAEHLRAIILLNSSDLDARQTLLRINDELGRRRREYVFRKTPLTPRL